MREAFSRHFSVRAFIVVVLALVVVGGSSATAAKLLTGANVKNSSLTGADIQNGSIRLGDLSKGTQALIAAAGKNGAKGTDGTPGATGGGGVAGTPGTKGDTGAGGGAGAPGSKGDKGDGAAIDSGNWGTINRNTIGSANAELRAGPFPAPLGNGSLNLNVGTKDSKIAYGDEVDFKGTRIADVDVLGFSVYQTGEDAGTAPDNLPNLAIEIDPAPASKDGPHYSTLVSVTPAGDVNKWRTVDVAAGQFYLTGTAGTASGCDQVTYCTLAEIKQAFPDATVSYSVAISKGRDNAFHGSVDALKFDKKTVDFEESGVTTR